jgi:hypothetical protein
MYANSSSSVINLKNRWSAKPLSANTVTSTFEGMVSFNRDKI